MKSAHWLTKAIERHGVSASELARRIGISQPSLSQHMNGVAHTLKDENCIELAKLLDMDPAVLIADQHLERAKRPEEIAVWQRMGKLIAHGTAATVAAVAFLGTPTPAKSDSFLVPHDYYYRSYRRWLRWPRARSSRAPVAHFAYS